MMFHVTFNAVHSEQNKGKRPYCAEYSLGTQGTIFKPESEKWKYIFFFQYPPFLKLSTCGIHATNDITHVTNNSREE